MIVIASYPTTIPSGKPDEAPLQTLHDFARRYIPTDIGMHLLPFHPSDGDGGFAPSDWFAVEPTFGTEADVRRLARQRPLVVDGIYNHIGYNHPIMTDFRSAPDVYRNDLHADRSADLSAYPLAPRGGSVMRPHVVQGQPWYLWQKFTEAAYDLNLNSDRVRAQITRHLRWLKEIGVRCVRLDAPAYYGKVHGSQNRHSNESQELTRQLVAMCRAEGLEVIAQLDCEERCLRYFHSLGSTPESIIDFSYPAVLAASMLTFRAALISDHLIRTWCLPVPVLRYPRSHDGIYLRSDLTSEGVKGELIRIAGDNAIPVRTIDGRVYELNCTLPELLHIDVSYADMRRRLLAALFITTFAPGWSYFYLPALLGYIPPVSDQVRVDPRAANRMPVSSEFMAQIVRNGHLSRLKHILGCIARLDRDLPPEGDLATDEVEVWATSLLILRRARGRASLVVNLDTTKSVAFPSIERCAPIVSERYDGERLGPLGLAAWLRPTQRALFTR